MLEDFGYPELGPGDVIDLNQALYDFLYERRFAARCREIHYGPIGGAR